MVFEANVGQFDERARFGARGAGFDVRFAEDGVWFRFGGSRSAEFALRFRGGAATPEIVGVGQLASTSNYFIGNDPRHWHSGVTNFGAVRYRAIYPGIDVLFHGGGGRLEYDFEVSPGADAKAIQLTFEGGTPTLENDGALAIRVAGGALVQQVPTVFATTEQGVRRSVAAAYRLSSDGELAFALAPSPGRAGLLIDPVLEYSSFLAGSNTNSDRMAAIAVDAQGSAYVTGCTQAPDFPLKGAVDGTYAGGDGLGQSNAFVTKFAPGGSNLSYSTYLGGHGSDAGFPDCANAIALTSDGSAVVAGVTNSSDFPTIAGAYQLAIAGPTNAFLVELNPTGSALAYSTFLGGTGDDFGTAVAVDHLGLVTVGGESYSTNFPLRQPLDTVSDSLHSVAFVSRLDPSENGNQALKFSTYLGDVGLRARAVSEDPQGRIYVIGDGATLIRLLDGGPVVDYRETLTSGFAGAGLSTANAIAVDSTGAAYIAGSTNDISFPTTAGAFQTTTPHSGGSPGDNNEAFVAKRSADGQRWEYVTYLGGDFDTSGDSIAISPSCLSNCSAVVGGTTTADDFPAVGAVAAWGNFVPNGASYLSTVNATGTALSWSTPFFIGTSAIAQDADGGIYIAGIASPVGFLAVNAFQSSAPGGGGAVAKIGNAPVLALTSVTPASGPTSGGTVLTLTGSEFDAQTTVTIGGVAATAIQPLSATELSATTPAHLAGLVDVQVSNAAGQTASLGGAFTYVDTAPDAGPDAGPDGGADAGLDAGPDAGPDGGADAGPDAGTGSGGDAGGGDGGTLKGGGGCASSAGTPFGSSFVAAILLLAFTARRRLP